MSVCLYNNRQIGRRIKDGMHANLLSCINLELWFGGRVPAELRAWGLGLGVPELGLETWALPTGRAPGSASMGCVQPKSGPKGDPKGEQHA